MYALQHRTLASFAASTTKLNPWNLPDRDRAVMYWKRFERVRRGHLGREAANVRKNGLQKQLGMVLEQVRGARTRQDVLPAVRSTLNSTSFAQPFEKAIRDLYKRVVMDFGKRVFRSLVQQTRSMDWKQGPEDPLIDVPSDSSWIRAANNFVDTQGGELIQPPLNTTRGSLREITNFVVDEAIRQRWGTEKIAREIQKSANDQNIVNRVRARRIARTEVITASNHGAMTAAKDSGVAKQKEWIHTPDDRVRGTHMAVGTSGAIDVDDNFTVGGAEAPYPAHPGLPARERINCRCTVAFMTASTDSTQEDWGDTTTEEAKWHDRAMSDAPDDVKAAIRNRDAVDVKKGSQRGSYKPSDEKITFNPVRRAGHDPEATWRHEYGHHLDFSGGRADTEWDVLVDTLENEGDSIANDALDADAFLDGVSSLRDAAREADEDTFAYLRREAVDSGIPGRTVDALDETLDASSLAVLVVAKRKNHVHRMMELMPDDDSTSTQALDFFRAMTRNRVGRGHDDDYYSGAMGGSHQSGEAFAQWFSMKARGDDPVAQFVLSEMEDWAPKTTGLFDEILQIKAQGGI